MSRSNSFHSRTIGKTSIGNPYEAVSPGKRYRILVYSGKNWKKKLKNGEHCRLQEWGRLDVCPNLANFLVINFPKRSVKYWKVLITGTRFTLVQSGQHFVSRWRELHCALRLLNGSHPCKNIRPTQLSLVAYIYAFMSCLKKVNMRRCVKTSVLLSKFERR